MMIKKIISVHEKLLLAKMQDLLDDPDIQKNVLLDRINEVFTSLEETLVELNKAELITMLDDVSEEILGNSEFDKSMGEALDVIQDKAKEIKNRNE